jgi:hypothetical protein
MKFMSAWPFAAVMGGLLAHLNISPWQWEFWAAIGCIVGTWLLCCISAQQHGGESGA